MIMRLKMTNDEGGCQYFSTHTKMRMRISVNNHEDSKDEDDLEVVNSFPLIQK